MARRVLLTIVAYLISCLFSGLVVSTIFFIWNLAPDPSELNFEVVAFIGLFGLFYTVLVVAFTLIPSAVLIAYAQRTAATGGVRYAFAGALVGAFGMATHVAVSILKIENIGRIAGHPNFYKFLAFELGMVLCTGACAGIIFWFITVRAFALVPPRPLRSAAVLDGVI
jgi:hypothetical protein